MTEIALALRWDFPWMTYHPWILKGIVCEVSWMELNDPENSLKLLHSESQNRWVSEVYGNYLTSGMPWEVSEFSLVRILCCSSPGSSVHGILQARILEWVAISLFRGSSWPRDQTQVSCTAGRLFNVRTTRMCFIIWASLVAQMLKNPPAVQETQIQSLGWEDPLEKEMATYSIILTWRIPWAEEPGRLQSIYST